MNAKRFVIARRDGNSNRLEYFRGKKSPFRGEWTCLVSEATSFEDEETAMLQIGLSRLPKDVFIHNTSSSKPDCVALATQKTVQATLSLSRAAEVFEHCRASFERLAAASATLSQVISEFQFLARGTQAIRLIKSTGSRNWLVILYKDYSIITYEENIFAFQNSSRWLDHDGIIRADQKIEDIKF